MLVSGMSEDMTINSTRNVPQGRDYRNIKIDYVLAREWSFKEVSLNAIFKKKKDKKTCTWHPFDTSMCTFMSLG